VFGRWFDCILGSSGLKNFQEEWGSCVGGVVGRCYLVWVWGSLAPLFHLRVLALVHQDLSQVLVGYLWYPYGTAVLFRLVEGDDLELYELWKLGLRGMVRGLSGVFLRVIVFWS
jgi:hypothetical protein